ncbi:MAG: hypothetical protein ACREQ9_06235, partial [Candidatus Binatia bacterium]
MSSWKRAILLVTLLALASCAGDGGGRGSGVSTVQGNVARVIAASAAPARSSFLAHLGELFSFPSVARARNEVEGIRVMVEGSDAEGLSDANGFFIVVGDFGGSVGLVFQRPEDGLTARTGVRIPPGGTLSMNNVEIDNRRGEVEVESQSVAFEGVVKETDCESERMDIASRPGTEDEEVFITRIDDEVLHDEEGRPVACEDAEAGTAIEVEGIVEEDGTVVATEAEVGRKPAEPTPTPTAPASLTPTPPPTAEPTPELTPTPE